MLEQVTTFNDLSPKLRAEIEKWIEELPSTVRFKFDISHPNPDPQKYNGDTIWPFIYSLTPITFQITDKAEDRKDKQQVKRIGIVKTLDKDGKPEQFTRVRVNESDKGILILKKEDPDHADMLAYIYLHPKFKAGKFKDNLNPIFYLIDVTKVAQDERVQRKDRKKAMEAAEAMSNKEVKEFADAMQWEETDDLEYLRNKVEDMAEKTPKMFNDLYGSKDIEYRATVKRALDAQLIVFDPVEYKFSYAGGNVIVVLGDNGSDKSEVDRLSEWLQTAGAAVYKKIKSLSKTEETA